MGSNKNNTSAAEKMFGLSQRLKNQSDTQLDFRERLLTFYTKIMRQILKSYSRNRNLVSILIFIETIQIISLLYNTNVNNAIQEIISSSQQKELMSHKVSEITLWFKYFRIYPLFEELTNDNNTQSVYFYYSLFCTSLNLILIGYIFFRFLFWVFIEYQDSYNNQQMNALNGSNYSTVNMMKQNRQKDNWYLGNAFSSRILQCYSYLFAIPQCEFAIRIISQSLNTTETINVNDETKGLGVVMLATALTLWLLTVLNEFDFSIIERDALAQRNNKYKWIIFIFNIIQCGLSQTQIQGKALPWVFLIFAVLRVGVYFKEYPYFFGYAQRIVMFQNWLIFINTLICVCSVAISNIDFSFIIIITLPIAYKLSTLSIQKKEEELLPFMKGLNKKTNISLINRYIRSLINLTSISYEDYISTYKGYGVTFETVYTSHIQYCQDEYCFCSKYDRHSNLDIHQNQVKNKSQQDHTQNSFYFNGLSIPEMHGVEYRRQFIIDYLNSLFGKLFNLGNNSIFQFEYNQYQKEVSLNVLNNGSYSQLGSTTGIRKMRSIGTLIQGNRLNREYTDSNSIQIKAMYVYYLTQIAKSPAKAFTQIFEIREAMLKDSMSFQSKYIAQTLIQDTFDQFYHFFCMPDFQNQRLGLTQLLEFDYLIKDLKRSMLDGLQKKQFYYEYLYNDFIYLQELVKQSEICILQKDIIEKQVLRLFDICPTHPKTFIIADIYIEYFDFKKRRIRNFVSKSQKIMNRQLRKTDRRIDLFSQKSCGLFISFKTSLITKVTYTAANLFSCQMTDLISKPFNFLIPEFLVRHTNKYLEALNQDGNLLWIQIGEYFSFVKNSKGYIIPAYLRSKLDIVDGNDFGLTIYIQPSQSKKEYIICDSQFQYLDSTKNITKILTKSLKKQQKSFQNLTSKGIPPQHFLKKILKSINICNIIPFLLSVDEFEDINDKKDYNEALGFKDQQASHINTYTSILAIPITNKQVEQLGQKVRFDAYEIDKYFCTYPSDSLQFLEISFSVLRQKSFYEPEKYIHFIEIAQIRRFRKQTEINDYISHLNEKLTKQYQSPIQIPLLRNSTFYYRPTRPPTVTIQQNDELQEAQELGQGNSPKISNSPTNASEMQYENGSNFEEVSKRVITDKIYEDNIPKSTAKTQSLQLISSFQFQNQKYDDSSPIHTKGIYDHSVLNDQNNQFYQNNQGQQNQMSFNQLFFSPRSEDMNGQIYSEFNNQNSMREIMMQENNQRQEDDNINQLLNHTSANQFSATKNPISQETAVTGISRAIFKQQSNNETDLNSITQINNYRNQDSFSMSNSLLSPELKRPQFRGKVMSNQIDNSYFKQPEQTSNNESMMQLQMINKSNSRKLIKLKGPPQHNYINNQLQNRRQKKNLTNINVDAYDDYYDEDDDEDEKKQYDNVKNDQSLKEVKSLNENFDQQNEFALQNNNSEDSEDLKKKQRDIIRDDSSVRTGESQFYSKKVNIFDIIINEREPPQMIYIKATGFLSFSILIILTFVLYLQLRLNFDDVWLNFTNLKIGPNAIEQYSQILRNYEMTFTPFILMCYTQIPIFPQEFRQSILNEGNISYNEFVKSIETIQSDLFSKSIFQEYYFSDKTIVMALSQRNQDDVTFEYWNMTRGQSLLYLPYYLKFYSQPSAQYLNPMNCIKAAQINDIYAQAFTYQNYNVYISSLVEISTTSKNNANDKLSSTKSLLIFSVVLVEVISTIIILVVFPVYYTIQGRKEEILKLLCTFNSDFISNQITRYRQAQHNKIFVQDDVDRLLAIHKQHSHGGANSTNQISMKFLSNQIDKKKRSISSTDKLKRYSLSLSFKTLCIFILLSFSPILNILLMRGFFENFDYNISELQIISLTKSYTSLNFLTTHLLINFPFYGFQEGNRNKLYSFINELKQDSQSRLQSFYEMDKNFQVNRYQIEDYKAVFLKTLKEDACEILITYQNSGYKFSELVQPEMCKTVLQGKLGKGIILGLREIIDKLANLQEMFKLTFQNVPVYMGSYLKWQSDNNLKDLETSYYYLRDITNLLAQFIEKKSKDYFDYLITVQLILFIEGLAVISIVFLFIGYRFIKSLGSTIYNTTFLFTLLPIDSLIENPYVFNYLSNERRRNKGK